LLNDKKKAAKQAYIKNRAQEGRPVQTAGTKKDTFAAGSRQRPKKRLF